MVLVGKDTGSQVGLATVTSIGQIAIAGAEMINKLGLYAFVVDAESYQIALSSLYQYLIVGTLWMIFLMIAFYFIYSELKSIIYPFIFNSIFIIYNSVSYYKILKEIKAKRNL